MAVGCGFGAVREVARSAAPPPMLCGTQSSTTQRVSGPEPTLTRPRKNTWARTPAPLRGRSATSISALVVRLVDLVRRDLELVDRVRHDRVVAGHPLLPGEAAPQVRSDERPRLLEVPARDRGLERSAPPHAAPLGSGALTCRSGRPGRQRAVCTSGASLFGPNAKRRATAATRRLHRRAARRCAAVSAARPSQTSSCSGTTPPGTVAAALSSRRARVGHAGSGHARRSALTVGKVRPGGSPRAGIDSVSGAARRPTAAAPGGMRKRRKVRPFADARRQVSAARRGRASGGRVSSLLAGAPPASHWARPGTSRWRRGRSSPASWVSAFSSSRRHRASVRHDDAPGGRHRDGAESRSRRTRSETPDRRFELRDLVADGRARVAEAPRRVDEASLLGDCDEREQRTHLQSEPAGVLDGYAGLDLVLDRVSVEPARLFGALACGLDRTLAAEGVIHRAITLPTRSRQTVTGRRFAAGAPGSVPRRCPRVSDAT